MVENYGLKKTYTGGEEKPKIPGVANRGEGRGCPIPRVMGGRKLCLILDRLCSRKRLYVSFITMNCIIKTRLITFFNLQMITFYVTPYP